MNEASERPKTGIIHSRALTGWVAVILLIFPVFPTMAREDFIKGVDLSILKEAQDHGVHYKQDRKITDPLAIFKTNGCNCVRLRLFVNPDGKDGQVNTLAYTLAMAKQVKMAGLKLYLDFHYSDVWADAGHQVVPAQWKSLTLEQLVQKTHDYTLQTLIAFKAENCEPDMVSIGNEITNGMMWPAGGPLSSEEKWQPLMDLIKAGIAAVRESAPASRTKVIIHLDKGGSAGVSEWFFSHCQKANLDYDIIGLSYYPFWHGTLEDLKHNLTELSGKYHKDILVAETAYYFAGRQGKLEFPCTPEGQKAFLDKLMRVVADTPGGRGIGVCYWEPAWIDGPKWNAPAWSRDCEKRALFDADGNSLPGLAAFQFSPARLTVSGQP